MQELLQISCLVTWLCPKLELYLGKGPAFDKVMEMWRMGHLGCMRGPRVFWSIQKKACIFVTTEEVLKNAVEFKFRCTIRAYLEQGKIFGRLQSRL